MPVHPPNECERQRRPYSRYDFPYSRYDYVNTPSSYRHLSRILAIVTRTNAARRALGKILRTFREGDRRSLSQERFAEIAEIDRTYYASIERGEGNPSFEMLWTIVSALGISWQELGTTLDQDKVLSKPPRQRS